jgi:hypothetical protein
MIAKAAGGSLVTLLLAYFVGTGLSEPVRGITSAAIVLILMYAVATDEEREAVHNLVGRVPHARKGNDGRFNRTP